MSKAKSNLYLIIHPHQLIDPPYLMNIIVETNFGKWPWSTSTLCNIHLILWVIKLHLFVPYSWYSISCFKTCFHKFFIAALWTSVLSIDPLQKLLHLLRQIWTRDLRQLTRWMIVIHNWWLTNVKEKIYNLELLNFVKYEQEIFSVKQLVNQVDWCMVIKYKRHWQSNLLETVVNQLTPVITIKRDYWLFWNFYDNILVQNKQNINHKLFVSSPAVTLSNKSSVWSLDSKDCW